ncbi:MAG TPA: NADP(H)-dependent aldo-keto reductase [Alphaproteobacteria bacterium]|nr:NADP(H)-dependent aldo-keto reductase [Alphaproteobacteria bacterium]
MEYRRLGRTDTKVSTICLGTMTWGEQNSESDAHRQLDFAVGRGVNFIDTAEMYPIPVKAATQGRTESYIGSWLKKKGNRDRVVVATKVSGRSRDIAWLRSGGTRLDRANIATAVEDSLTRLGIETIDLYQLHWPDRRTNFFGSLGYVHKPNDESVPLEQTLSVLSDLVKAGKIRHAGVSNETPWGLMRYLQLAETQALPRVVAIQNPYSLLNRTFEIGLAEAAIREACGLLAYSPLGFGVLTGKYLHGAKPARARLTLFPEYRRYTSERATRATESYVGIARRHGMAPAQLAIAYAASRPFVTSVIVGATDLSQLEEDIAAADIRLPDEALGAVEAAHNADPNPSP